MEIDFILYGPRGLIGIEIKRSKNIDSTDLKALKAFQSDYPSARLYILYGGNRRLYFDTIEAIPVIEALQTLPNLFN